MGEQLAFIRGIVQSPVTHQCRTQITVFSLLHTYQQKRGQKDSTWDGRAGQRGQYSIKEGVIDEAGVADKSWSHQAGWYDREYAGLAGV